MGTLHIMEPAYEDHQCIRACTFVGQCAGLYKSFTVNIASGICQTSLQFFMSMVLIKVLFWIFANCAFKF